MSAQGAGYSGTPLPRKLGIKEGHALRFVDPPADFAKTLGEMPAGVVYDAPAPLDVAVLFVTARERLEQAFRPLAAELQPAGGLWVAWPKRTSGVATDVTEDVVRAHALASGLVDNKVCAIDATWSGLRCVYRLRDRPPGSKSRASGG